MRICSLLPSATEVVVGLGLTNELVAISHECDYPPEIRIKPVVVHSVVDPNRHTSAEIDTQVRSAVKNSTGLYRIDDRLLSQACPTLVITQDLCEVCAVTPTEIHRAMGELARPPEILTLNPTRLEDVFQDITRIGTATRRVEAANQWVTELRDRLANIRARVKTAVPRRVICLEWLEPLYSAGHWVPELVGLAGGVELIAKPGMKSREITWEQVRELGPDVLLLMPCGFVIERTVQELKWLTSQTAWTDLPAVRHDEVYAVDGPAYFNRPGPRLVDGVELLARLFHADRFPGPPPAGARRIS